MADASAGHSDIAQWLAAHCRAWNDDDVSAMFAAAAPDLHWVNVVGMHWQGFDAAVAAHHAFFRQMFAGVPLDLVALESVAPIGPEVRVAVVHWRLGDYVVPTGGTIRGEENRMSLVFSGVGDQLQLRHVANVRIDPIAAAHDPVRHSS